MAISHHVRPVVRTSARYTNVVGVVTRSYGRWYSTVRSWLDVAPLNLNLSWT